MRPLLSCSSFLCRSTTSASLSPWKASGWLGCRCRDARICSLDSRARSDPTQSFRFVFFPRKGEHWNKSSFRHLLLHVHVPTIVVLRNRQHTPRSHTPFRCAKLFRPRACDSSQWGLFYLKFGDFCTFGRKTYFLFGFLRHLYSRTKFPTKCPFRVEKKH